jgi:hypothetical protein
VGAGGSLEAAYRLSGPIGAGSWNFVMDGICLESVDVTFELLLRAGGDDTTLASFTHHFDPPVDVGDATAFEQSEDVDAVDAGDGDELVIRFSAGDSELSMAWFPNGEGDGSGGRIPYLDLPSP